MPNQLLRLASGGEVVDPATGEVLHTIDFGEANDGYGTNPLLQKALNDKVSARRIGLGEAGPMDYLRTAARIPGRAVNNLVQAAISGVTLPGDVASGKQPIFDPRTGHVADETIARSSDLAGTVGSATLAAPIKEGVTLGSGAMRGPKPIEPPAEVAKPFFSAAERAVDASSTKSASPQQWAATLKNAGVKQDELDWTGLSDMLAKHEGPLTREAIKDYIGKNQIQIEEVRKGEYPDWTQDASARLDDLESRRTALTDVEEQEFQDLIERENANSDRESGRPPAITKFSQYQLPGGDNYREVLFKLPKRNPSELSHGEVANLEAKVFEEHPDWSENQIEAELQRRISKQTVVDSPQDYTSSHWDEPNVLAHARVNDRYLDQPTDADIRVLENKLADGLGMPPGALASGAPGVGVRKGVITPDEAKTLSRYKGYFNTFNPEGRAQPNVGKKTLFIEEIQSDWHQQGRKQGYAKGVPKPEDIEVKFVPPTVPERANPANYPGYWESFDKRDGSLIGRSGGHHTEEQAKAQAVKDAEQYGREGIPDAPFKRTWPDLVLKRMVREAAENGYDQIAWTDGATQAARYDMSKQVKQVIVEQWDKNGSQEYIIKAYDHHDNKVINQTVKSPAEIADYIGKDAADKAMEQITNSKSDGIKRADLRGLDLQVGGEGMKGFYDKILPDTAKKLFGKLGGKVEKQKLGKTGPEPANMDLSDLQVTDAMHDEGVAHLQEVFDQRTADKDWSRSQRERQYEEFAESDEGETIFNEFLYNKYGTINKDRETAVHVMRITPEMRDTALRSGFPLFSGGPLLPASPSATLPPGVTLTPVDHDPFEA